MAAQFHTAWKRETQKQEYRLETHIAFHVKLLEGFVHVVCEPCGLRSNLPDLPITGVVPRDVTQDNLQHRPPVERYPCKLIRLKKGHQKRRIRG